MYCVNRKCEFTARSCDHWLPEVRYITGYALPTVWSGVPSVGRTGLYCAWFPFAVPDPGLDREARGGRGRPGEAGGRP